MTATLDAELAELLVRGDKVAAIKLLRERAGMGLAAAKSAVEAALAGAAVAAADRDGTAASAVAELPAEVLALATTGRRVEAIRLLRERSGCDLKSAKDQIDRTCGRVSFAVYLPDLVLPALLLVAVGTGLWWLFG